LRAVCCVLSPYCCCSVVLLHYKRRHGLKRGQMLWLKTWLRWFQRRSNSADGQAVREKKLAVSEVQFWPNIFRCCCPVSVLLLLLLYLWTSTQVIQRGPGAVHMREGVCICQQQQRSPILGPGCRSAGPCCCCAAWSNGEYNSTAPGL
jgi:hypothetical protein